MPLILMWIINALTLLLVANIVPGFEVSSFYSALIVALVLGLVNAVIRPIVLLLTLPINLLTLGLFTFIINAIMLSFVATVVKGFSIDSFSTAVMAAIILWGISFISNLLVHGLTRDNA